MSEKIRSLILAVMLVGGFVSACGLLREPEEASGPIEATPVLGTPSTADLPSAPDMVYPAPTDSPGLASSPEPETNTGETTENPTPGYPAPENLRVYTISQAESQVRFELDEDLRGERKTVVGVTDQVAGEIALDLTDLNTARVGVIQINARTLITDNNLRNRAIQNEILDTGQYEFITFSPRSVIGLPASVEIGEEVTFSIEGDLTIRNISHPVTFTVVARAVSSDQIVGTASAVINRKEFDLSIPSVPNVANVEEEVELYIEFAAYAQ
jgi:polyisoprenoid-binding protein YceI